MTRFGQVQDVPDAGDALAGHIAEAGQFGRAGPDRLRVECLGEDHVQRAMISTCADEVRFVADHPGQLGQDAPDFILFFQLQLAPGVVRSTVLVGSIQTVAPLEEWSWTMPLMRPLNSARSGIT